MKKFYTIFIMIVLLNTVYITVSLPIVLVLVYLVQTVTTLHLYHGLVKEKYPTMNRSNTLYVVLFVFQFAGLSYSIIKMTSDVLIGIIIAFLLSSEIWIIEIIGRVMKKRR